MQSANSGGAIDAMGRRLVPDRDWTLAVRFGSAIVLALPALVAFYAGPPYSDAVVLIGGGIVAWEWARLCGRGAVELPGILTILSVIAAISVGIAGDYSIAGWLLGVGAIAATMSAGRTRRAEAPWFGIGVVYLGLACLAVLWLRQIPGQGRSVTLWLLAVVWATDIAAYFAGRGFGGPKLAPSISPKKTWSGLAGGVAAATVVGAAASHWLAQAGLFALAAMSAALAIVSQVGDLFESSLKRRFGTKDSSNLIPGHGGLLDRVDGLLAAALMLAALIWLTEASF